MGRNVETRLAVGVGSRRDTAIAAMNEGHAYAQCGEGSSLQLAVDAYTRAIELLSTEHSTIENANSLGAAYMNRGQLRHRLAHDDSLVQAEQDFVNAVRILLPHTDTIAPWPRRNLIGSLLNHANLLLDLARYEEAEMLARSAIEHSRRSPLRDLADFELAVLARRAACDAIGHLLPNLDPDEQEAAADAASTHVCFALRLIRSLRPQFSAEPFSEASGRLFRFGSRLLALRHPTRLAGFLVEHLEGMTDPAIAPDLCRTAIESVPTGVDTLAKRLTDPTTEPEEQDRLIHTAAELYELHQRIFRTAPP